MPLPLHQAAAALDIHPQTLRGWVRDGAPVAQRGGAGRGKAALYDVEAIKAWREPGASPAGLYRVLASELPELIADALYDSFRATAGPHKSDVAGALAGAWYVATLTVLDRLRVDDPSIPELESLPRKVSALREVFAQSGSITSSSHNWSAI